ncbi:MAG: YunC family protein, partial [Candidatus Micrarchaeota archaeon]
YVSCGYINPETAEKMKDCAVIVSGVDSFSDLLKKKVSYISKKAKKLGINKNMTGLQALEKMID